MYGFVISLRKNPSSLPTAQPKSGDEAALERRARDLERQAQKLQEEVARSGLGADMKPVPEPTVRDLSVPEAKPAAPRVRKTTLPGGATREPEIAATAAGREETSPAPAPATTGRSSGPKVRSAGETGGTQNRTNGCGKNR